MPDLPTTEKSLWREYYTQTSYKKLTDDIEVDVAIVGAGITGLTSAYLLKQAGLSVAVIEKDTVGGGTTGRTTGKVTAQHGITYYDLQHRLGRDPAKAYGEANQAGLLQMADIIKQASIACDWERDDNYVYTTDSGRLAQFKQEAAAAVDLGLPASFTTSSPLPFEILGAVKFADQAKVNTQKYLLGLAKSVYGGGSYVFEHSSAIRIRDGSTCRVKTLKGSVYCKDIIVATNVPTSPLMARGGYCILEYPTESFIVSGQLVKPLSGMYISPDKHHYSILPIKVDGVLQLLVGGEGGHLPGLRLSKTSRYKKLASYANQHFGVDTITNTWSDRDYLAYDNLPLVGKLYPWSKHVYVGTAFRKWGLTNGTAAGMILTDLITDRPNPYAAVFNPNRTSPITSIPHAVVQYLKN